MTALLVVLAIVFVWACIATAVSIANEKATGLWRDAAKQWQAVAESHLDRLQSNTLGEYHAARSIAMHAPDPGPPQEWLYDDFGMMRSPADPRDDADG